VRNDLLDASQDVVELGLLPRCRRLVRSEPLLED
jgi:hypothetical protein